MSVQIDLPDNLDIDPAELKLFLAAKLFDAGRITSGQGAAMVGMSKEAFIRSLGRFEVSYFSDDPADLANDIANA